MCGFGSEDPRIPSTRLDGGCGVRSSGPADHFGLFCSPMQTPTSRST